MMEVEASGFCMDVGGGESGASATVAARPCRVVDDIFQRLKSSMDRFETTWTRVTDSAKRHWACRLPLA